MTSEPRAFVQCCLHLRYGDRPEGIDEAHIGIPIGERALETLDPGAEGGSAECDHGKVASVVNLRSRVGLSAADRIDA